MNSPKEDPVDWLRSNRVVASKPCPTFEELTNFIRDFAGISQKTLIAPETQFEDDLGITGDDGCELLEEVEKRFDVRLSSDEHGYRETFHLASNEYLFHSEASFFYMRPESVRRFTVGELYSAIQKKCKHGDPPAALH